MGTLGRIGLLAEVVADHVGHVGVGQLVVGHPVAHRVGDGHVACPGGVEDPGAPHDRVRAEVERVEEVVVHPPVDHVHTLLAARGPHVDETRPADQVAALHQLDAHLAGEKGVLEEGGVEDARA